MKYKYLLIIFFIMGWSSLQANSVIGDLESKILDLEESEELVMKYTFVGCFGPYHQGSFHLTMKKDTIHYLSKSIDKSTGQSINQAGKYARSHLLILLAESKNQAASEILGNSIHYQFETNGELMDKGTDYIDQRHFIEIFHPFTSFLKTEIKTPFGLKKKTIRGVKG